MDCEVICTTPDTHTGSDGISNDATCTDIDTTTVPESTTTTPSNKTTAAAETVIIASSSSISSISQHDLLKQRSSGMDPCGLQMREQDADWLEAMHVNGGPNKTGMTPILMSASSTTTTTTTPATATATVLLKKQKQLIDGATSTTISNSSDNKGITRPLSFLMLDDAEVGEPSTTMRSTDDKDHSAPSSSSSTTTTSTTTDMYIRAIPQSPTSTKKKNHLLPFLTAVTTNSPTMKHTIQQQQQTTTDSIIQQQQQQQPTDLSNYNKSIKAIPLRRAFTTSDRPVLSGTIYEEETATISSTSKTTTTPMKSALNRSTTGFLNTGTAEFNKSTRTHQYNSGELDLESGGRSDHHQEEGTKADADADAVKERRKITEVAQFADAIGDNNALEGVQIIEDDDDDDEHGNATHGSHHRHDDDDDDDDATEIHVQQQQRNLVGGLVPIKVRSSTTQQPVVTVDSAAGVIPTNTSSHNINATRSLAPPLPDDFPETPVKVRPHHHTMAHSVLQSQPNVVRAIAQEAELIPSTTDVLASDVTTAAASSSLSSPSRTTGGFLTQLPTSATMCPSHDFVYFGIGANPPEVVKRGTTRGNYAQLHRKAWLEVTDKYHRYGKNLRLYYRYWESQGHPTNIFFDWLDSKGDAAGNELPELKECPRRQLDSDTVLYITNPDTTQGYAIKVIVEDIAEPNATDHNKKGPSDTIRRGRMYDIDGQPVCTGPDGWIFVLRDNIMYGAKKITSISGQARQRFHHSSFFGGKAVAAAGILITDDDGYLTRLYPHSGHYRPGEAHMQRVLFYLYHEGVDLRSFEMDTQQIMHVARDTVVDVNNKDKTNKENTSGNPAMEKVVPEKKKKIEGLHLMPAVYIACFLAHKARFIAEGIFVQIHQIRQSDVASVSEALAVIDNGGFWRKQPQPQQQLQ